jgi:hypothetical protein
LEDNERKVQHLSKVQVAASVEFLHIKSSSSFEGSSSSIDTISSQKDKAKIGVEALIKAAKTLNSAA